MSLVPLASLDLWEKTVTQFLRVLELALNRLRQESELPEMEPEINRRLFACLLTVVAEIDPKGEIFASLPWSEALNQPDFDEAGRTSRENKRPDISWGYRDLNADPLRSHRVFVIECKRLGHRTAAGWILNNNYVSDGVCRFIDKDHGYAQAHPSGAMVGYVESMEFDEILREVNEHIQKIGITLLVLAAAGWQAKGVSRLSHEFERPFPISPFKLDHFWLDIRYRRWLTLVADNLCGSILRGFIRSIRSHKKAD